MHRRTLPYLIKTIDYLNIVFRIMMIQTKMYDELEVLML